MLGWDEEFCKGLADKGYYIIRFDNRDFGRSVAYEPGTSQYSIDDMADDAVGVLDAYNIESAHIAGMSLGGVLAQIIALRHPKRALTLTLISTTNYGFDIPDLPAMDEKVMAYFSNFSTVDWSDEQAVIELMVEGSRVMPGTRHPFDAERAYKLAQEEVKRTKNIQSRNNHALLQGGDVYYPRFKEVRIPALIIHGTADPVIPYEHAKALENELHNSVLLTIEGMGHEIHRNYWDDIINTISEHISAV